MYRSSKQNLVISEPRKISRQTDIFEAHEADLRDVGVVLEKKVFLRGNDEQPNHRIVFDVKNYIFNKPGKPIADSK